MLTPKISVIVPVHNGAATLESCLQAVLTSELAAFECIVVDDTSRDSSAAVARRFPVRLVELDAGPSGPGRARNSGAAAATGDILFFVDADVVIKRDTLRHVAASFAQHPEIVAVFGSYDEDPSAPDFLSQYKNLFHYFVHQRGCEEASTFWGGCGAIRRDTFLQSGGFDAQRYPRASIEDVELGCRLRAAGHRILLNKQIQGRHLKRWTLRGLLRADIFDRGIPWTLLILRNRHLPDDLNLKVSQRLSAFVSVALVVDLILGLSYRHDLLWFSPVLAALVVLLNRDFYRFFARKRGWLFALGVFPLHLLYYLYSLLSFAVGMAIHLAHGCPREGAR